MRRRRFLGAAAAACVGGLAGCSMLGGGHPTVDDPPAAVYRPAHVEGMAMAGTARAGPYRFALTYATPHRFWQVSGSETRLTGVRDADDVHLMVVVWDAESATVLPEVGLTAEVRLDGELVAQEVVYPMLSQRMGFHYGRNFELAGDGDYRVTARVEGVASRLTGAYRDRLGDPASAAIDWSFAGRDLRELSYETVDGAGDEGAVAPMEMEMLPDTAGPATLPGATLGRGTVDDAVFRATVLDEPPTGADPDRTEAAGYLAVSARTPHNHTLLPMMGLSATVRRDGEVVFEDQLARTLDPDLSYHYGAVADVRPDDEVALRMTTPPQVARHAGYETAMLRPGTTSLSR